MSAPDETRSLYRSITPAQAKAALEAYEALKAQVVASWRNAGDALDSARIVHGIDALEALLEQHGLRDNRTTPNFVVEFSIAEAAMEGVWDDVDTMLNDLFHKHLKAAKEAANV